MPDSTSLQKYDLPKYYDNAMFYVDSWLMQPVEVDDASIMITRHGGYCIVLLNRKDLELFRAFFANKSIKLMLYPKAHLVRRMLDEGKAIWKDH